MTPSIPTATLAGSGEPMPLLSFGTGTAWCKEDPTEPRNHGLVVAIKAALQAGIRHIDAAEAYGTEEEVGQAIRESGISRADLFVTTKVQGGINDIPKAINDSLSKLGLEYVDLYLIHWPYFTDEPAGLQRAWKDLEVVCKEGKAKAIGIANYIRPHLDTTLETANIKPMVNQIEHHPYLQRADDFVPWMQAQGIHVEAFSPLVPVTKAKQGPLIPVLERIAANHGAPTSAVLLRWQMQKGIVAITTTTKTSTLAEYVRAADFELTGDEMKQITDVGLTYHFRTWGVKFFDADDRT